MLLFGRNAWTRVHQLLQRTFYFTQLSQKITVDHIIKFEKQGH